MMRYGNAVGPIVKREERYERERGKRGARDEQGERELGPKLGCNYSRLPCKLSRLVIAICATGFSCANGPEITLASFCGLIRREFPR